VLAQGSSGAEPHISEGHNIIFIGSKIKKTDKKLFLEEKKLCKSHNPKKL
jgi:hypothetical protein